MGVMSCYRTNCDEIMCHTYVDGVGYICRECQDEFKNYLLNEDKNPKTEYQIKRELEVFMETDKDSYSTNEEINVEDFFDKYSRD